MRRFHFKLAPLKKHRSMLEKEKQVALSKSLADLRGVEAKLMEIDQREIEARKEFAALGSRADRTPLSSSQFWLIDNFVQGQMLRRKEMKRVLEQRESKVKSDYAGYVRARQDLKVMETLEEKEFLKYRKEKQKLENKQVDELYTLRDRLSTRHEENEEPSND